jgi:antitoxin ParD1/3/4
VRRDQEKQAAEGKLRKMIEEARASGVSERTFDEIWEAAAAKVRKGRRAR